MEIVAPAGDSKSLEAAIKGGADAVYLGLKGFGARRNAPNFYMEELIGYIDYAHKRGVKLYLTMNTIFKDVEIEAIMPNITKLYEEGIDAVIVQDFGFFSVLKSNFRDLPIHASTQMTISNSVETNFLYEKGFQRVVLARELSFEEIKKIRENSNIELEIFVSGSMCVCYSGKCYLSSMIGHKSGNRGLCAQPCRKLYYREDEKRYFLSPKDQMMGKYEIDLLRKANIHSIKIEGRMKNENYVYAMVKYYRELLDGIDAENDADKIFNRGYSKGYFYDKNDIINKEYSANFGYKIAEMVAKNTFRLTNDIMLGDGISFVTKEKEVLRGEYLNKIILKNGNSVKEGKKGDLVMFETNCTEVYKNYDKKINDKIESELKKNEKKVNVDGKITAITGKKLTYELFYKDISVLIEKEILEESKSRKLTVNEIEEALRETGNTNCYMKKIEVIYDDCAFISFKILKEIKREAVENIEKKIVEKFKRKIESITVNTYVPKNNIDTFEIAVYAKEEFQWKIAKDYGIKKVYTDNDDIIRENNLQFTNIDSNLAKNLYEVISNRDKAISIDTTLNILNSYSLSFYREMENIDTVYLSKELSFKEMEELKKGGVKTGVVIYGYPKVMYVEYSIFDEESVRFTNDAGDQLLAIKNKFGNTEIYLMKPINIVSRIEYLKKNGINEVRIDFLNETDKEVREILDSLKDHAKRFYEPYNYEEGVF